MLCHPVGVSVGHWHTRDPETRSALRLTCGFRPREFFLRKNTAEMTEKKPSPQSSPARGEEFFFPLFLRPLWERVRVRGKGQTLDPL
jgi:hypothetical protein